LICLESRAILAGVTRLPVGRYWSSPAASSKY